MDSESVRVLRVILSERMMRGGYLMKEAGIKSADDLVKALQPLLDKGLVVGTGRIYDPEGVISAQFHIRPSDVGYVQRVISENAQ